jgi:hypothetical protein
MKKVAIFVEGQAEQIFIRNLLYHLINPSKFSFGCLRLQAGIEHEVPYPFPNPNAEVHFQIVNVQGDEGVLSAIREREELLFNTGFTRIIGLRDMYSKAYRKRSRRVDSGVTEAFTKGANDTISRMKNPDKIRFYFSIMELEAWWLGMYNLFSKIDGRLTPPFIEDKLSYNLPEIDPQREFFHPAQEVDKIFRLVDSSYGKSRDDVERITSKIDSSDIDNATENKRCERFGAFCEELLRDI